MAYDDILVPPDWLQPGAPPPPVVAPPAGPAPAPSEDWVPADWMTAEGPQATPDEPADSNAPPSGAPSPIDAPLGVAAPAAGLDPGGAASVPDSPPPGAAPVADSPTPGGGDPVFPWETPEGLRQGQAAAAEPVDMDFSDQEAEDAEVSRILAAGPEDAAAEDAGREHRREQLVATRRIEEDTKNRQWAERNAAEWRTRETEYQAERQAIARDTAELAKKGINNDNWFESLSTGKQIAVGINAIIGGLLAPHRGGKNTGIEFVMDAIERDIATQKANLAHQSDVLGQRRGLLAEMTAASGDAFRAEETLRMAAYQNVDQRLAAEAAKYDPAGTRAQKIAEARLVVQEKAAKAKAEAEAAAFDRKVKEHSMRMARAQLAETRAGRIAQATEATKTRDATMLRDGFVPDAAAPGGYRFDPTLLPKKASPSDLLAGKRAEKLDREMAAEERGRLITFRGKNIGMAKTETEAKELRARQGYYDMYQKELTELANMVSNPDGSPKVFYQGPGWKLGENKERDAVGAKARKLLYLEAKINDPNSAVREAEIEFGKEIVPYIQGFTEAGVNPRAKVEQLLHSADTALDADYDAKLDPEETRRVLGGEIDRAATPVGTWKAARQAGEDMRKGAAAATEEEGMDMLLAKSAAGTPPEQVAEFVAQKSQVLDRWARDQPWMFERLNTSAIKARWASDPSLSEDQKRGLNQTLDAAVRAAYMRVSDPSRAPRRAPHQPARPDLYPELGDDED